MLYGVPGALYRPQIPAITLVTCLGVTLALQKFREVMRCERRIEIEELPKNNLGFKGGLNER